MANDNSETGDRGPAKATDSSGSDLRQRLRGSTYGDKILRIWIWVTALGAVVAAVILFISARSLITPARRWLLVADAVLVGIVSVIQGLSAFVLKDGKQHKTLYQALLGSIVLIVGLFGWVIATEGSPDLPAGGSVTGELEPGDSILHRFEANSGESVVLRVRKLGGLELRAVVTNGEQEIPVAGPPEGGPLELSKVLVGGVWTLQLDSINDASGRYRVDYDVTDRPRSLIVDTEFRFEHVNSADAENGYLVDIGSGNALITIDAVRDDLALTATLYRGTRTEFTRSWTGDETLTFASRSNASYVLVVKGDGTSGGYHISLSIPSPDVEPTVPTSPPSDIEVTVPDIYDLEESEAYEVLADAGLQGDSIRVCSGSVAADRVRQAFIVSDDGSELIVGDEPGASVDASTVNADRIIYMKISTGEPC